MTASVKLLAVICAVAFLGTLGALRGCDDQGALKRETRVLRSQNDSLRQAGRGLDTVYLHDTLALTRWRTRYDTLFADRRITDTLWVKQFVVTADSTIRSCTAAIGTCESQKANLRAQIVNVQSQLDLEKKRRPSVFGCAGPVAVSNKGVGLGAGCGIAIRF